MGLRVRDLRKGFVKTPDGRVDPHSGSWSFGSTLIGLYRGLTAEDTTTKVSARSIIWTFESLAHEELPVLVDVPDVDLDEVVDPAGEEIDLLDLLELALEVLLDALVGLLAMKVLDLQGEKAGQAPAELLLVEDRPLSLDDAVRPEDFRTRSRVAGGERS